MTTVTRLSWLTSAIIARGRSQSWTQHGAGGDDTGGEIAPQCHHQLARQGDDGNAPDASFDVAHPLAEPARQRAVRLVHSP